MLIDYQIVVFKQKRSGYIMYACIIENKPSHPVVGGTQSLLYIM